MSKILLIKPRFINLEFNGITQPLGLMYIGATLKKAGHEVKIHDCAVDYKDLHILKKVIADWNPDFVGLSIIITELEQTKKIMKIVREFLPKVPVAFGGPWPSANPEESIKTLGADFVVLGEGELAFISLINAKNKGVTTESIPGTASIVNGNLKINQGHYLTEDELNTLPFPAWELLDHKLYAKNSSQAVVGFRPYMAIVTSRGCPYRCAYCHQTMGKVYRKRSAESVLAELEELRFKYGFKEFEIVDDCFNLDRERMLAILNGIREKLGDVRLHFPNGLRSDMLEPEDMFLFKRAGTVSACFAIETSSARLQKMIHKNLNIERVTGVINAAVKEGIYSSGFFILGFPTENYEEAFATVTYALNSSLHRAVFFIPKPFEGTELLDMISDAQKKRKENFSLRDVNYYDGNVNISAMTDSDFKKVFKGAYISFYTNPKRVLRLIRYHPQPRSLLRYIVLVLIKIFRK